MKELLDFITSWVGPFDSPRIKRAFLILIQVSLALALVIYFAYRIGDEVKPTPCAPGSYPARCYRINQQMCESIWNKSEGACRETIHKLGFSPMRLIGPIIFKCQLTNLDKIVASSRIANSECDQMRKDLEAWKMSNPDFR